MPRSQRALLVVVVSKGRQNRVTMDLLSFVGLGVWITYADVESVQYRQSWWSKWVKVALRASKLVARFNVHSPAKIADILKGRGAAAEGGWVTGRKRYRAV